MGATSAVARRERSQLRPVKTSITSLSISKRRSPNSISPVVLSAGLPSPSITAARSFYSEHETVGPNTSPGQWLRSPLKAHEPPRRHSAMPGDLEARMATFTFASPTLKTVPEFPNTVSKVKVEASDDVPMTGTGAKRNDLAKIREVASRRPSTASAGATRYVPFRYIHDHLRDWGNVYLGNTATADVFVNAVGLRQPSMAPSNEDSIETNSALSNLVTIRARVLPKAEERNPFIIQRQFDIDELRRSIPSVKRTKSEGSIPRLRRSARTHRPSALPLGTYRQRRDNDYDRQRNLSHRGKEAVPLHVEYALHYLPVLGALLLSGHVRKGDSVDLPMPHPGSWPDVVSYIYTSKPEVSPAMKENILFFAGNCSE